MSKLPVVSGKQCIKALEKIGFVSGFCLIYLGGGAVLSTLTHPTTH